MLDHSGIATDPESDIALVGRDDHGNFSTTIYGDPALGSTRAVTSEIAVPGDVWQLRAVPKAGWPHGTAWQSGYFRFGVLNSLILAALCWLVRRQRQLMSRNLALSAEMVARRPIEENLYEEQRRIRESQQLLYAIVDNAPVLIYVFDTSGRRAENRHHPCHPGAGAQPAVQGHRRRHRDPGPARFPGSRRMRGRPGLSICAPHAAGGILRLAGG